MSKMLGFVVFDGDLKTVVFNRTINIGMKFYTLAPDVDYALWPYGGNETRS